MVTERYGVLERAGTKLGEIRAEILQYGTGNYDQPMLNNMPDLVKLYLREALLEMLSAQNKLSWAQEELGKTGNDGPKIKTSLETA